MGKGQLPSGYTITSLVCTQLVAQRWPHLSTPAVAPATSPQEGVKRVPVALWGLVCATRVKFMTPVSSPITPLPLGGAQGSHRGLNGGRQLKVHACKSLSDHRMNSEVNIITPLPFRAWAQGHPDRAFVDYVVNGIKEGFRIRFNRSYPLKSACSNLPTPQGSLVQDYLSREASLSSMVTWTSPNMDQLHISPLELISKHHKPGKWQLIVDLSSPKGRSINDEISLELASVQYTHVDHLVSLMLLAGRGSVLVKVDIKEVYRNIPVHPDDHHLLAVQ